ncbi:hypothetical protein GGR56DRAFT_400403 [Xylariaceae sp. FL0804]|nr:hypothetical protein GGR56DRAFT_400403 [Xylariaceae sp. FL0804]
MGSSVICLNCCWLSLFLPGGRGTLWLPPHKIDSRGTDSNLGHLLVPRGTDEITCLRDAQSAWNAWIRIQSRTLFARAACWLYCKVGLLVRMSWRGVVIRRSFATPETHPPISALEKLRGAGSPNHTQIGASLALEPVHMTCADNVTWPWMSAPHRKTLCRPIAPPRRRARPRRSCSVICLCTARL